MSDEFLRALMTARDELELLQPGNYFEEEIEAILFKNKRQSCLDLIEQMIKSLSPQPTESTLDDLPF